MKEETKEKLINSSIKLFSKYPYEEVAIVQICKNASVSNGIFYSFFKNKEELFRTLVNEASDRIKKHLYKVTGSNVKERMESFIRLNIEVTKQEFPLIIIYREGQYKFIEFEQRLRKVYLTALKSVYSRELDEFEYLFIISGIRFINIYYTKKNITLNIPFLTKLLLYGLFDNSGYDLNNLNNRDYYIRSLFNKETTRHKLLKNGEKLFGNLGYHNVKVGVVAGNSGVKVGGFYHHFPNKEQFLREIIEETKREVINFLKDNIQPGYSNSQTHILFLYLLLEYYQKASYKYSLIRESEFITEDISMNYFKTKEKLYMDNLNETPYNCQEKQIIASVLQGISHYMGIEFFYTKNIKNKKIFLERMNYYFTNGINS